MESEDPELLADFAVEAREHLAVIERELLALERDPLNGEGINTVFRAFHTIKGMAGFLELESIQRLAHHVEALLDRMRNDRVAVSPDVVDVMLQGADFLRDEVDAAEDHAACRPWVASQFPEELVERIEQLILPLSAPRISNETMGEKMPDDRRMAICDVTRSVLPESSGSPGPVDKLPPSREPARSPQQSTTVRVETAKLNQWLEMVGEMATAQSLVQQHPAIAALQEPQLTGNLLRLSRITKELQNAIIGVRMLPIGQLFHRYARLVRDLSRRSGKEVALEFSGEDTEIDRKIVDELSGPLLHMIRNAIDHGIETTVERAVSGKNQIARLRLSAYHQGGFVVVEIADDGRGLDREKIVARAIQKQLIQPGDRLSDDEVNRLIFTPGFSTAETVTGISGRGVGMDVVRSQVEKLRGRIDIRSTPGLGTQFFLRLPLSLASIDLLRCRWNKSLSSAESRGAAYVSSAAQNAVDHRGSEHPLCARDDSAPR